ncbi:hypothetical protein RHSIM_Rhsim07G0065900 [Rhododendron simsii]|uniref:Disease resistance RPP13-like protein 1 n=1 Tax=Rhododendron simsii TaxID=118357 RepID=A0A834GPP0_RHOSS|nr:hypothetical protein RHSIM_Rhsim07G0065900 [Rhododendron simsii]
MVVAEIFLGAFVKGLVRVLTSRELLSFARRDKIDALLTKWSTMLDQIDAVLADAEEKQTRTDQSGIQRWLEDLEDLAYDLDDMLDEFSTEALRQQVLKKESRRSTSKVRALIPTCCTRFHPSTQVSDFRMRSKMDELTKRLKDLFDRRTGLHLQIVDAGHSSRSPPIPPTSSLIHETGFYGRDEDQKAIIELLLRDQSSDVKPSSSGEFSLFVMHDLINDLAQFVARRTYFRLDEMVQNNEDDKNITKARHSSYIRGYRDGIKRFEVFRKAKNLRSFLPFGLGDRGTNNYWSSFLTSDVPLHLLPSLSHLHVLSLSRYRIFELPGSIGDLKHVRFLDLSFALIATLPESISTMYNLQTLILSYCTKLNKLPTTTSNLINLRHLDVTGADSLQEMPPKIGELTCLQTLSNFIVSQDEGTTINELKNLIYLRGTLCISGLENVEDALDASRANLKDKQGLDVLLMKWSNVSDNSRNGSVESNVLDMLKPHINLKELTIIGYHGLAFPTWVGNSLFRNMVSLKFQNCENCISLPPLGQLPSLENLHIQGMKVVENIGLEFYGLGCSNPFRALVTLTLEDMPEWKDWSHFGVKEKAQAFICLSELSIKRCPKLLGKLPENLPRLRKLKIEESPLLVFAWAPSPTELNQVSNTLHFELLISLSLSHVLILDSWNLEVGNEAMLENARYSHLSSLISLTVENIQGLRCLPGWFLQGLTGLQELFIRGCQELTSLWKNEVRQRHQLPALRRLRIEKGPQLTSFCEEDENEDNDEGLQLHEELPYLMMLEHLEITSCEKLENLPQDLHNLTTLRIRYCEALRSLLELTMLNSLEILAVCGCPLLTYLSCSKTGLPPTLKSLWLDNCGNLESILAEEGMKISCPSLERVLIYSCESLKSLPDAFQNNYNSGCLRNLSELSIHDCENLESIPEGWFTATNLRELRIYRCKKLKGPPYRVYNNLTTLQKLSVDNCASATGLVSCILNNAQFTNLTALVINDVDMGNKPRSEWGLHRLSSLTTLYLVRYDGASFPPEEKDGMMQWLPPSLTTLRIFKFPNLEKLYCKDFQNLPSLGELEIRSCPKLMTITELGQLPSLSELLISNCPNIESFSAEDHAFRLPPSLLYLDIWGCPLLKERCEKKNGQYWPLISHIPEVEIDGRLQDTMPQLCTEGKIDDRLIKWNTMLREIDGVLADAEEKQMSTDQRAIKLWLDNLEDYAYDLDDVLDEFSTEALRQQVLNESRASTSKGHLAKPLQRQPTSSFIHEPRLYGRDGDQKVIIELLLSDQSNNGKFDVVPIVGMGGVGKTTLAQMVYYNEMVKKYFDIKACVCVSEGYFDIMGLTKAILESITSHTCDLKTLDQVQDQLKSALAGKKFLIVLDDVWDKNHGDWSKLQSPFNNGALGSKVIVTSRLRDVALTMTRTDKYYPLKELSEDDCWSVFAQLAFQNSGIDASPKICLRLGENPPENNEDDKNITKARHSFYIRGYLDGIKSQDEGSTINELENLIHLRGALCISGLENVADTNKLMNNYHVQLSFEHARTSTSRCELDLEPRTT